MSREADELPLLESDTGEAATDDDWAAWTTSADQPAERRHSEAVPKSAARAVVVFCAALLAFTLARSPPAARSIGVASAVEATSLEVSGAGSSEVASKTGCHNWEPASMHYFVAKDEDHCVQSCLDKNGCIAVNFQTLPCIHDDPQYHGVINGCHLLSKSCDHGPNHCWELITLKNNTSDAHEGNSEADIDHMSDGADEADSETSTSTSTSTITSTSGHDSEESSGHDSEESSDHPSGETAEHVPSEYPPDATGEVVFADYAAVQFDV